ncbi:MAG: FtsQ-type POTRA domain-containing protein, partial [Deltaproteobacteria bacterium]|nr:FtsQ-type POTRA domain-containing protein [Deltaproteobacteria bacterium]
MRLPWLRGHNRRRHQSVALLVRLRLAGQQAGRVLQIVVPIVMVAGLLGGVVWSVYRFVTTTPYFQLRRLELSGLQQLREEEVREWAGLSERTHLLALDPLEVARRLKQQPWVADARAERYLPDRLVVHIVERKPAALLLLEGLHLVDQH